MFFVLYKILFYLNRFINPYFIGILSAIKFKKVAYRNNDYSRNPYFIGILSAIYKKYDINNKVIESQSLFYWNPFCNS